MSSSNSNSTSTYPSQTTHADRVAGWIAIGLFVALIVSMCLSGFLSGVDAVTRSQIVGIGQTCAGALAATLTLRRSAPTPDSSQQVTIPGSADGSTAGVTLTTTTGTVQPPAPPPAGDPGAG